MLQSAPLILAPFSEVYGRAGLYIISAFGFAIFCASRAPCILEGYR